MGRRMHAESSRVDSDVAASTDSPGESNCGATARPVVRRGRRAAGRLMDLQSAEEYSGISAWTLRDLIASGDLPAVRPPRLRRLWIDRADLDRAILAWKERA